MDSDSDNTAAVEPVETQQDPTTKGPADGQVEGISEKQITPLIRDLARREEMSFQSCLDIGCGRGRYDKWFQRFQYSTDATRYVGLDSDPVIVDELKAQGLDIRPDGNDIADSSFDLTLGIEVLEHLLPEETPEFLEYAARVTRRVAAFTTPNFEYWETRHFRQLPEFKECRWIPDHAPVFNPAGGPHSHKQSMSPAYVTKLFATAFPAPEWNSKVFRAWPWELKDLSTGNSFTLYFKIFGLAWRAD